MARTAKKKEAAKPQMTDIKVGDRVEIISEGPRLGQRDGVVELDHEERLIRLAGFGWVGRDDVKVLEGPIEPPVETAATEQRAPSRRKSRKDAAAKAAEDAAKNAPPLRLSDVELGSAVVTDAGWLAVSQILDGRACCFCGFEWTSREAALERRPIVASPGAKDLACQPCWDSGKRVTIRTTVDGKESDITFDGKSGAPVGALVKPPLEDLIRSLGRAKETLADAAIEKKRGAENYKDAQGAVNAIVDEIVEYYGHVEQLSLEIHTPAPSNGVKPALSVHVPDEDEEQEDEEEVALTGAGATVTRTAAPGTTRRAPSGRGVREAVAAGEGPC